VAGYRTVPMVRSLRSLTCRTYPTHAGRAESCAGAPAPVTRRSLAVLNAGWRRPPTRRVSRSSSSRARGPAPPGRPGSCG
jgi:hypothetical protein